ncbi:hypothetical protein PMAYCL1PPCAC_09974, partial [Pristionchus mayeri]
SAIEAVCPGGLPAAEVKGILESHNRLRSNIWRGKYSAKGKLMPAAKRKIPPLKWDCTLENAAQNVTNQCIYAHSTNRINIGENLWTAVGMGGWKGIAGFGKEASNSWKAEFQDYGWPSIIFTEDDVKRGIWHATQMAWSNTTKIGCGVTICEEATRVIVACHYD